MTESEFMIFIETNAAKQKPETLAAAIRFMRDTSQVIARIHFGVGDEVSFKGRRGEYVNGIIIRMNRTTATVLAKDKRQWRVSMSLLQKPVKQYAGNFGSMITEVPIGS
jgi:hypothetical protein